LQLSAEEKNMHLTDLQKQLCNILQDGLPVCPRPFLEVAKLLDNYEQMVLQQTADLKKAGVIRRLGAIINHKAIGVAATLVTAHVPQEKLQEIADAVNSLEGVSHNYLREHHYNLWFTLQGSCLEEIESALSNLSSRFSVDFHSLPIEYAFKLHVRFSAERGGQFTGETAEKPNGETVELNEAQKSILLKLQNELQVVAKPFDFLCGDGLDEKEVLKIIADMNDKGVIRRIGAVVDHYKLGFVSNVLFVCKVAQEKIAEAGRKLACAGTVSHCYQRKTFEHWPYNLFAMMHGRNMDEIRQTISKFVEEEKIESYELLPTAVELKKQPVNHPFD
jgi:DNA-binding Lrp family transcriptional regulator